MRTLTFVTHSVEETERLGERLGEKLAPGDILAYTGDLGAGKTAFTRGIARGVGYPGQVTSPTFNIVNEYIGGRAALFHFDLYRLSGAEDLYEIGWDDYLDRAGICVLEWSEIAAEVLGRGTIRVDIRRGDTDSSREITITGVSL